MPKTTADRIALAQAAFEAGFASKAGQKRALEELNRGYNVIRDAAFSAQVDAAPFQGSKVELTAEQYAERNAHFRANDLPFDLHQVRDRHIEILARWTEEAALVRDLIALRAAIKDAPIAPAPEKPEAVVKAEAVRRSIVEEMERRKAMFVEGLDLGRVFAELFPRKNKAGEIIPSASLPVTVNAHWVRGHKGTDFVRHFFYLGGKLTPLQTIMAIADTLDREA